MRRCRAEVPRLSNLHSRSGSRPHADHQEIRPCEYITGSTTVGEVQIPIIAAGIGIGRGEFGVAQGTDRAEKASQEPDKRGPYPRSEPVSNPLRRLIDHGAGIITPVITTGSTYYLTSAV